MITEENKRREAFKFNADLSDKDIRSIGASAQGMITVQYEFFHRMTQFIIGDMAAQFSEQNEFIKNMFSGPLKILEKLHDIVLMQSKIPLEIPDGEYLEDPDEAESF